MRAAHTDVVDLFAAGHPLGSRLDGVDALADLIAGGGAVALTGAGMSTDSGIPDYRGPDGTRRVTPMTITDFRSGPQARQRYWARGHIGWRRFAAARPNPAHEVVAGLQRRGHLDTVITQNVDGLHQRAGASGVLELHGSLARVVCLACGDESRRDDLDARMGADNPGFANSAQGALRPDGDVELAPEVVERFVAPTCLLCGSDLLKPDVVFFGESVPKALVETCFAAVEAATALVVLGSSLQVMSGLRFVRRAAARGVPVAVVTRGATRGDDLADVRLDAPLGVALPQLAARLTRDAVPR